MLLIVTRSAMRSPRRVGRSVTSRRRRPPGSTSTTARSPIVPADGGHASRTMPRSRRPSLTRCSDTRADWPSRTVRSPVRCSRSGRTGPAKAASTTQSASTTPLTTSTPVREGTAKPTTRAPSAANSAARPVRTIAAAQPDLEAGTPVGPPSARNGHGGQDGIQHRIGGDAFELSLRAQDDPVPQGRPSQRLDVVGGHEIATGQPGPGPAGS